MLRKICISFFVIGAVIVAGRISAFAQFAALNGKVVLEKPDHTKEPVVGALVEAYRIDIKNASPPSHTNKKGEFVFAGLPFGSTYALSVSAPNCAPLVFPNVRVGRQDNVEIILSPGDGKRLTEEEARKALADTIKNGNAGGELTNEQKKEQEKNRAEYDKKVAANQVEKKKAEDTNKLVNADLNEGKEALKAHNYDLAIAKFKDGVDADPNFAGSAPILLNNLADAYTHRAADTYNKNRSSTDIPARLEAYGLVKKDFADAAASYKRSLEVLKTAQPGELSAQNAEAKRIEALQGIKETVRLTVLTEQVDPSVIEVAKVMIPEYLKVETDAAKKAEAKLMIADLYRVSNDFDNAIAAYKAIMETSPDDLFALAGAGLSLVNVGYMKSDSTKLQEGANYLQRYTALAPDGHKFKADALGLLDTLKKDQNITPVKGGSTKKKP